LEGRTAGYLRIERQPRLAVKIGITRGAAPANFVMRLLNLMQKGEL
jgi:hypothetical protein